MNLQKKIIEHSTLLKFWIRPWSKMCLKNCVNFGLRAVYTCDFVRSGCHPGVCNKLVAVSEVRFPFMIRCSLSSTLSLVKHILQDVNLKAQNCPSKQPFRRHFEISSFFNFPLLQKNAGVLKSHVHRSLMPGTFGRQCANFGCMQEI